MASRGLCDYPAMERASLLRPPPGKDRSMLDQLRVQCRRGAIAAAFCTAAVFGTTVSSVVAGEPTDRAAGILFREAFDDARLPGRGWYDGQTVAISRGGGRAGGCIEYHWKPGTTTPGRSSS